MKKIVKSLLLFSSVVALASCGYRNDNAYEQGRFFGPFLENFYAVHDLSSSQMEEIETDGKFQNGYLGDKSDGKNVYADQRFDDSDIPCVSEVHSEIFGGLPYAPASVYTQQRKEEDSSYIGQEFGRTKCLGTIEPSFKDTGVLSKLYNGLIQCRGQHNYALVQFKEEGMDSRFPKTCGGSSYFLMTFRGGSIIETGRLTYIDLNLRFYYDDGYAVSLSFPSLPLRTDWGAERVNMFGFSFSEMGIDPNGMIGYGLSYSNLVDEEAPSEYQGLEANDYWGLLVYEVMLLDSNWR